MGLNKTNNPAGNGEAVLPEPANAGETSGGEAGQERQRNADGNFDNEKKTGPDDKEKSVLSRNINLKRIFIFSLCIQVSAFILIFILSKSVFYSILFLLGAIIGVAGFFVMIKMVDMHLRRGKGKWLFFVVEFAKMAVIAGAFYFVAQQSKTAVLLFILGLSIIVASIMAEAVYQLYRSYFNGS
ncbi:MAG: ATP synthase subunit I [bacterium]|nr:ATP synthase subunit I [bacterium]